jgi:hypothetical protein
MLAIKKYLVIEFAEMPLGYPPSALAKPLPIHGCHPPMPIDKPFLPFPSNFQPFVQS